MLSVANPYTCVGIVGVQGPSATGILSTRRVSPGEHLGVEEDLSKVCSSEGCSICRSAPVEGCSIEGFVGID